LAVPTVLLHLVLYSIPLLSCLQQYDHTSS
jgi:hypothetical protein